MSNSFQNVANDYSVKHQDIVNQYQFLKLTQMSGSPNIAALPAESIFEIPLNVVNFSKSNINFTFTPGRGLAGTYNRLWLDLLPFKQVQLYTRGNVVLCDINYLDKYSKITLKSEVLVDDALTPSRIALIL